MFFSLPSAVNFSQLLHIFCQKSVGTKHNVESPLWERALTPCPQLTRPEWPDLIS